MLYDESSEAWNRLTLFLSRDVLDRRYQARHGGRLSADKAKEIISNLDQARQYFSSAASAGVLAGPLEQYYGVLSFSRAIVLYLDPRAREATLRQGHGLHATLPGGSRVENIEMKVRGGTFDELLAATGNRELILVEEPAPGKATSQQWFVRSYPRPQIDTTFSLVDLLARIPALRQHFEEAFGTMAHCYAGNVHQFMRDLNVTIFRDRFDLPIPKELGVSLGIAATGATETAPSRDLQFRIQIPIGDSIATYLPNVVTSPMGGQSIVEPFPGGWSLCELASYFAAAHVLSMIVRYHPSRWTHLVSRERGDRVLPVLDRMRGLIQTEFVRLGLREIER
jgi:hypothetical protein